MTHESLDAGYEVAYQGAPGAYSEAAARALHGPSARLLPSRALEDVFAAVAAGRARFGVVPLENSIAGTVPDVYELLLSHDVEIVGETCVAIDHALIGAEGMRREDVRRVLSHPMALNQCRNFFRAHPQVEPVAVFDTAGAVEIVTRAADGMTAAIGARHAASVYGGTVLAEHLQDHAENWTRFALVATSHGDAATSGPTKTVLAFDLLHRPGSLIRVLEPLSKWQVNLTKIESRPIPAKPFEYRFVVELSALDGQPGLAEAVAEMRARTTWLRVLGSYAAPIHHSGVQS